MSPKGKASVTIQTAVVEGDCLKACPATSFRSETGAEEASLVKSLAVSIGGKEVGVPPFVYSGMSNVQWATLEYKSGYFDLAINEGADEYVIHIYFAAHSGLTRMTIWDRVAGKIVEDARLYPAVMD